MLRSVAFLLLACAAFAVESRELPRFPALETEDALASFAIRAGFHLELVAAEPDIASPVAMAFDASGRLFVAEMRDYPESRDAQPHLGRIRLLEDRDGDGRCEVSSIFADDLAWPTAVICARGGIFVCATPDVWWLRDADGDGRAEVREVVFTGFNSGAAKLNVQALPNSFAWGPDNRIHLQTGGGNRGVIRAARRPELAAEEIAGRDFWFDPKTDTFGFETGGGQFGMSFDDAGQRFACNNSDHLRLFVFPDDPRAAARNPFFTLPSPLASIAADGPAAEVFRRSPDEPWRVMRTRWRVEGRVPGIVEGGGRVSGYFTGATGTTVYRGDAFGAEFVGNTFTGDAGGNLVHRKTLRADGAALLGERPADERGVEFLASRDTWFRPVAFANAPDGALYVADMYREVIEHPWSLPEEIKKHLDLTSGRERGRIWRIAPDGFHSRPAPRLGSATIDELVTTLAHPNGWHRDTATRLLIERADRAAIPALEKMLAVAATPSSQDVPAAPSPRGRLHALRALDGLGALSDAALTTALADPDALVREHAVRLTDRGTLSPELWEKLRALATDGDARIRLALAFTIADSGPGGRVEVLAALARQDAGDRWIGAAILSAPPQDAAPLLARLAGERAHESFLAALARIVAARGDAGEIAAALALASAEPVRWQIVAALGRAPTPSLAEKARGVVADAHAPEGERAAAVRVLGPDDALFAALRENPPPLVAEAILDTLTPSPAGARLAGIVATLPPATQARAVRALVARPATALALLRQVAESRRDSPGSRGATAPRLPATALAATEVARLREHRDKDVAALVATLFPVEKIESRAAALARLAPTLTLAGEAEKGRALFAQRCATCHRFRGEGVAFGPDLESTATGGREKLLTHLVDPNREVAPQFAAYSVELKDGAILAGIVAAESPAQVTLREIGGRETILAREKIARLQTTGRSPMPEGLEAGLANEALADLLAFLSGAP